MKGNERFKGLSLIYIDVHSRNAITKITPSTKVIEGLIFFKCYMKLY
jgi:hypothetical protein